MRHAMNPRLVIAVAAAMLSLCVDARAQTIGTFRWQFAPYCNTVILTVEGRGPVYQLTGYDDECGSAIRAAASGSAHLNADGTVGMGITIVRPDGVSVESAVALSLATLSGAWNDGFGNSGTFAFNPSSPAGSPRPLAMSTSSTGSSWHQTLPGSTRFLVLSNMGDVAVLDRETGLVWERAPVRTATSWAGAQASCATSRRGGRMGWRLPSTSELMSLIDPSVIGASEPALPPGHPFGVGGNFGGVQTDSYYWTATADTTQTGLAWIVRFTHGAVATTPWSAQYYFWCVRGGANVE